MKTLCMNTRGISGFNLLKKKELYDKIISEKIYDTYIIQQKNDVIEEKKEF